MQQHASLIVGAPVLFSMCNNALEPVDQRNKNDKQCKSLSFLMRVFQSLTAAVNVNCNHSSDHHLKSLHLDV